MGILITFTEYFDMPSITQHVDLITLHAYDFRTPQRNYEDADYSAPLYFAHGRQEHQNANYMVKWFIDHGAECKCQRQYYCRMPSFVLSSC